MEIYSFWILNTLKLWVLSEITKNLLGLLNYLIEVFLNRPSSFQTSKISTGLWTNWDENSQKQIWLFLFGNQGFGGLSFLIPRSTDAFRWQGKPIGPAHRHPAILHLSKIPHLRQTSARKEKMNDLVLAVVEDQASAARLVLKQAHAS
jgi:hypothetical protein